MFRFFAIFCAISRVNAQDMKNLTIGGYFPLDGPCWTGGLAVKLTADLALDQVNNRTDLLSGYKLHLISNDTKCEPGVGLHILYDHIYTKPTKIMLLGAAFSAVTQPIADTAKYWNLLQVSYGATSPLLKNRALYPRFFRTISSDSAFNPARAALLRMYGWKRVATLHQNEPSGIFSHATKTLHKVLHDASIEVVAGESFTDNPAYQLANIKKHDARIIVGSFYEKEARHVFCEAYKQKMYGKKYAWIIIGWYDDHWWKNRLQEDHITCSAREMSEAVEGYLATDHMKLNDGETSSGTRTISGWTARQYAKHFKKLTGLDARHESSFAYDAVWAMALALNTSVQRLADEGKYLENFTYADSKIADILEGAFYNMSFLGVTGLVSFTKDGERLGFIQIEQMQGGESQRVGIYDVTADTIVMNKRIPIKWQGPGPPSDRTVQVTELKSVSTALFTFMAIAAVLGILLGAFFLLINFFYRERRIIKMSSPRLNNLIVVGCMMTYLSVFLFGLDGGLVSSVRYGKVCIARSWIMSLGFTLAFGAMFAKTWRVHAIFKSLTPKKMVIRDEHLFLMVGVFVALDVLLLSVWTGIEPMQTGYEYFEEQMRLDDDREIIPALEHCESRNLSYWLGAVYAFKGLLLVFGVFLAWETRAVTIPALNDSRYIGMSVYNVVILSVLGVAITSVISSHQNATFAITAVFTIFCTTITLCFVFLPKVTKLWSPDGGKEASTTRRSTVNIPDLLCSMDKNAISMTTENSQLKKMLAEREQRLMELRRLLETLPPESGISEGGSSTKTPDKPKTRRKSLVKFKEGESTYVNENFVNDEDHLGSTSSAKGMTNSAKWSAII